MVNVLRRWSKPIMVIITALVCVSFLYWGPNVSPTAGGKRVTGITLYGEEITEDAFTRQGRKVGVFAILGGEYIRTIEPSALFGRQPGAMAVARSFVLEREMDQFGLAATDEERLEALNRIPRFQGEDDKFDPNKFMEFKQRVLNPQGFSDADFDQVFLAGEVRARKMREIVGSTVAVTTEQVREQVRQQRMKTEASYVAFRQEDLRKEVKVTEEDLKKRYEEQKDHLKTPEQRKVRYAAFALPLPATPAEKPLEQRERIAQLQALANKAYEFREELETTKGNFTELAKKYGATVDETKDFFSVEAPPAELAQSGAVAAAAFKLTKERPYSPHVPTDRGTYVLELLEVKAPEQRPFDAVKKELEDQIMREKADELARAKANEVRPKLQELIKGGKKFADAAKELGLKVEEYPAFGGGQRNPPGQYADVIPRAAAKLAPGEISDVQATPANDAALIVHVDHRSAGDEKDVEGAIASAMTMMEEGFPPFRPGLRSEVFGVWLDERCRAAGLRPFEEQREG